MNVVDYNQGAWLSAFEPSAGSPEGSSGAGEARLDKICI